jgi:hypothetical protein
MNFSVLPPEINSLRIFAGAGSGPMLAAAAAWDGLADELASAATSFTSVTSGLAGASWQGPASQAMSAAAVPYAGWLSAATAQAEQAATQARTMASAFEAVRAAIVHPAVVAANRADLLSLVQTNLFGFNAPAIATAEAEYEEMWAVDVAGMFGYYTEASAAVSTLTPFTQPLQGLAGLVPQLAGGAQAAATALPAAATQSFNLLGGLVNVEVQAAGGLLVTIGTPGINLPPVHIPPINLSAFDLPQITLPPINIPAGTTPPNVMLSSFSLPQITLPPISIPGGTTPPNVMLSPFSLPQITLPSINIPAGQTPPGITVGSFSLPEITTPTITVPPINLPAVTVPGFNLPSIGIPRIGFPQIQFPDLFVGGNNQTLVTIDGGALLPLVSVNLQTFDITASLGFNTPGFINAFDIPPISIGGFNIPSIGLASFDIPSLSIPPINLGQFALPQISWPGFATAPLTIPPIGIGNFTLPQLSWPGFATPPLTVPPIGLGAFSLPDIEVPSIVVGSQVLGQFEIPPLTRAFSTLVADVNGFVSNVENVGGALVGALT